MCLQSSLSSSPFSSFGLVLPFELTTSPPPTSFDEGQVLGVTQWLNSFRRFGVRYADGSYCDVTDENIQRYEKQQISNVSSTHRILSHLPDQRPTSLVLADYPSPNLIPRWGPLRSLLRASRVSWFEPFLQNPQCFAYRLTLRTTPGPCVTLNGQIL